jgi:hypothetical protein
MNVLISEGDKHLEDRVKGRGLSENELMSLSGAGVVLWLGRKTAARCFLKVSTLLVSFIV